jgi:predicted methyltransferase
MCCRSLIATTLPLVLLAAATLPGQEQSVNPGINDSFRDPDVDEFVGRFEVESREVFARRNEIVAACQLKPGMTVADIGAGTGLFTQLFSEAVGEQGRVIAVDISDEFLEHIQATSREAGRTNITALLATADSTQLPPESIDVAFICDTYHHFEFPLKTMKSVYQALKPGGRVIVVDFRRIPGLSSEWVMNHVRAGQDVVENEIISAGLQKLRAEPDLLKENYFVTFQKPKSAAVESFRPGRGQGRGRRGPPADVRADQELFHFLLANHDAIRRTVTLTDNGVETLTESDNPEIASKIQQHVAAMHRRIKEGRGLRFWDDLFVAIFRRHASIEMVVENTEKGVRVKETSDDPAAVALIQAHANVVSQFVALGFEEAHKNHPVPAAAAERN